MRPTLLARALIANAQRAEQREEAGFIYAFLPCGGRMWSPRLYTIASAFFWEKFRRSSGFKEVHESSSALP